ncbi:hypothetical protein FJ651_10475 [Paucihalobacter ruber]|uniref:Uncharacterized protein n=1 Tax=Paucihalobacter ruber TaxID=2567861 RepID=A0A506PIQ5_9FLAO|nr:hypothetical protein [Paucihalobacter ruber]TPV33499.1 hypothetical protein FJ651_10475 [Paucihalobacter ruber]
MSAEIVLLLVGVVLLLVAIGDSIKINGANLGLMNFKFRIILGVIGVMLVIFGGYYFGLVNLQSQIEQVSKGNIKEIKGEVETVEIISPLANDAVKCRILTMGVYPEGHDKDIWVVLKPSDGKYYPQSDDTNTSYKRNGEWQVITRFGGDKDEAYDIIVYETDTQASQYFSTTIEIWKKALNFPGLEIEELPSGAIEVDRITVSLADNCRGVF